MIGLGLESRQNKLSVI